MITHLGSSYASAVSRFPPLFLLKDDFKCYPDEWATLFVVGPFFLLDGPRLCLIDRAICYKNELGAFSIHGLPAQKPQVMNYSEISDYINVLIYADTVGFSLASASPISTSSRSASRFASSALSSSLVAASSPSASIASLPSSSASI